MTLRVSRWIGWAFIMFVFAAVAFVAGCDAGTPAKRPAVKFECYRLEGGEACVPIEYDDRPVYLPMALDLDDDDPDDHSGEAI